jgi:uncharacterized protein
MWETGRYMVHAFEDGGGWYIYDVNANDVMAADEVVARIAQSSERDEEGLLAELSALFPREEIENALSAIEDAKKKRGAFREWDIVWAGRCPICADPDNFENKMQQIVLETTTDCNLRCRYCIFTHQREDRNPTGMTVETARKAIEYYLDHSQKCDFRGISLYGGEPLLKRDILEVVVGILEARGLLEGVMLTVDTNGTLIDDRFIDFVVGHGINVQVSIDGPGYVHDANRVLPSGRGTHDIVTSKIMQLRERIDDFEKRISFVTTIAPPYDIPGIDEYFQSLCRNLDLGHAPVMSANFATLTHVKELYEGKYGDTFSLLKRAYRDAVEHYISYCAEGRRDELGPIYTTLFDRQMAIIYRRSSGPVPGEMGLNACCIPGVRKLYVNTKGEYLPCERMSCEYVIGDVDRGIDHELVDSLYEDLGNAVRERCTSCWAMRLCSLCFVQLQQSGSAGSGFRVPESVCRDIRSNAEQNLKLFLSLHRADPNSVDFLKTMRFE